MLKKIYLIALTTFLFFSNISHIYAIEQSTDNITPKSGGLVSIEYVVSKCTLSKSYWSYTDLVDDWGKCSKYVVTKTVTKGSSTTLSINIDKKINDQLKANYGIDYTTTVSTSSSIGREFPADPTRNSKLRHKVQMKDYNTTIIAKCTYYDTATGYYVRNITYTGILSVPNRNETYIEVYYK